LHQACYALNVTNLDLVELLLKAGADPNAKDNVGFTPLMCTTMGSDLDAHAPGVAKFLLKWPTTDVNITDRSGVSFLAKVFNAVNHFSNKVALPNNPDRVVDQFLLQQWSEIEDMLVERGAHDTEITAIE
jgi:ankyrin repeat protein